MWLAHQGHEVDLITDVELNSEGQALLEPYKVVVTGSHPEYHTPQMLDALQRYRDSGGRLVYLGGNGFYWKIALDPAREGIVEGHHGIAKSGDARFVAESLLDGLTQHNRGVFHRVVNVDLGVARCLNREVGQRVLGERREHVVEEGHRGRDVRDTGAVEVELKGHRRLARFAGNARDSGILRHAVILSARANVP
jgi:hypothetical protein